MQLMYIVQVGWPAPTTAQLTFKVVYLLFSMLYQVWLNVCTHVYTPKLLICSSAYCFEHALSKEGITYNHTELIQYYVPLVKS